MWRSSSRARTTSRYWNHAPSNCNTALPTSCARYSSRRTAACLHCGALCGITSKRTATSTRARPSIFWSTEQRAALTAQDGKFRVSLYKALLYVEVAEAIKSGALNLAHSEKYRSLDEYLIPEGGLGSPSSRVPATRSARRASPTARPP